MLATALGAVGCARIPMYQPTSTYLTDAETNECVARYKAGMNDPSSFQLVSKPMYMDQVSKGATQSAGSSRGVFSGTIRGRNRFGGLVLNYMSCEYLVGPDGTKTLVRVF